MRRAAASLAGAVLFALVPVAALTAIDSLSTPSPVYRLPWPAGTQASVLQAGHQMDGFGVCRSGCGSHADVTQRFAIDFDLAEGTAVLAARGGRVSLIDGNWPPGHCGALSGGEAPVAGSRRVSNIGNEANFVEIDHGDGTSALYLHLSRVDPAISRMALEGGRVTVGQRLGWSGRTGNTGCHPHLHFQVEDTVRADWFTTSRPVMFSDSDVVSRHPDGLPVEGETYTSDNTPTSVPVR